MGAIRRNMCQDPGGEMPRNSSPKAGGEVSKGDQDRTHHRGSYFLSFEVEQVRCFGPKQILDLSDGQERPARWTILLGENGVGKTTLLQLLTAFDWIVNRSPGDAAMIRLPRILTRWFPRVDTLIRRSSSLSAKASIGFVQNSRLDLAERRPPETHRVMILLSGNAVTSDYEPAPPICYAYGAGRRLGSTSTISQIDSEDATWSLFVEEARLLNAEEWLLRLDYSASKSSESAEVGKTQKKRLDLVIKVLTRILPDVAGVRFTSPTKEKPNPTVEFETPYGWVPLRQLGYGYRTMIAWIVDFASRMVDRYPDSADPLAEPAVVLVDEIDLHLHPRWQRELIGFLTERFPNTQFIATAHSPLIVQAAGDANIALLRREGDHVVIENDPETIHGWSIDQILTSDLYGLKTARPPDLEDLLQRRKELLTQPELTQTDRKQLAEIESKIGPLPPGESFEHAKTIELIRETVELLKRKKDHKP